MSPQGTAWAARLFDKAGRLTVGVKENVTIAVNAAQFTSLW